MMIRLRFSIFITAHEIAWKDLYKKIHKCIKIHVFYLKALQMPAINTFDLQEIKLFLPVVFF